DGKIVMAGFTDAGGGTVNNFAVARINPNGTLDSSFDRNGKVKSDFGFDDRATGVAVQIDGKIVVGGFDDGRVPDLAFGRLNTNCSLDTSFNSTTSPSSFNGNGKLSFTFGAGTFGGVEKANAVVIQPGGKIVMAGFTDAGGTAGNPNNFAVARINPNGTLDASFASDGKVTVDFTGNDQAQGVALQPDGKIVLAGFSNTGGGAGINNFAVARLIGANVQFMAIGGQPGRVQVFN